MRFVHGFFAVFLLLAGCSTNPPEPPTVDGKDRTPINTPAQAALFAKQAGAVYAKNPVIKPVKKSDGISAKVITVNFAPGSSEFKPTAAQENQIAELLPSATQIELRARTDASESDLSVARKRAINTGIFLIAQGVPSSKIKMDFSSMSDFVATNATKEGQAKNRRVEIAVYEKQ